MPLHGRTSSPLLLPSGLGGVRKIAGAVTITSVSFITYVDNQGLSTGVFAPASGIEAGDILVIASHATSVAVHAAFTSMGAAVGTTVLLQYSYRIADGTEDGGEYSGLGSGRHLMFQFRANAPVVSLSSRGTTVSSGSTNGDPAQETLDASAGVAPVIGFTAFATVPPGAIDPRTTSITPTVEANASSTSDPNVFYVHAYIQNSSPANYTWDMDDEGSLNLLGGNYLHTFLG